MATKFLQQHAYGKMGRPVFLEAVATIGAAGTPTLVTATGKSKGIASLVRNGVGDYTVTFVDTYAQFRQLWMNVLKSDGNADVTDDIIIKAEDVASGKTINFLTLAPASTVPATVTFTNRVVTGGLVKAATTQNAQTGEPDGATEWKVNVDESVILANNTCKGVAASVDLTIHTGTELMNVDEECIAAIYCKNDSGTFTLASLKGAVAAAAAAVAPNNAAITAAVGHEHWTRLANVQLNRTADTTLTQVIYNGARAFEVVGVSSSIAAVEGVATDPADGSTMYLTILLNDTTS